MCRTTRELELDYTALSLVHQAEAAISLVW
jgi:hypothetical protein